MGEQEHVLHSDSVWTSHITLPYKLQVCTVPKNVDVLCVVYALQHHHKLTGSPHIFVVCTNVFQCWSQGKAVLCGTVARVVSVWEEPPCVEEGRAVCSVLYMSFQFQY